MHDFRDHFIFYNEAEEELIFPVDNTCKKRKQISEDIHSCITRYKNVAAGEVEIPIRFYFSDVLDNIIFTNPQYLVNLVTSIIRASFVDSAKYKIFEDCTPYPGWNQQLRHGGIFESKLLDALQDLLFVEGLFTKDDFLALMAHLCIISPLNNVTSVTSNQQYFIPAVLPYSHVTKEEKKCFMKTCQPMVLQFRNRVVPQVSDIIILFITLHLLFVIGSFLCYCSSFAK